MAGRVLDVQQGPYLTGVLHALKYPHAAVNGVFLGSFSKESDGVKVSVKQAVPLLHSHLSLAPMMDAAMALVDEHCAKTGMKIVGYYHANPSHDQNTVGGLAKRLADKIHETVREGDKEADPCLMLIDNLKLEKLSKVLTSGTAPAEMASYTGVVFHVKTSSGSWTPAENMRIQGVADGSAQARLRQMVEKEEQMKLIDFDNHLDDNSKGWLTVKAIEE